MMRKTCSPSKRFASKPLSLPMWANRLSFSRERPTNAIDQDREAAALGLLEGENLDVAIYDYYRVPPYWAA